MNSSSEFKVAKDLEGILTHGVAIILTFDLKIMYASEEALKLHGWTREGVIDQSFSASCDLIGLDIPVNTYIEAARAGLWSAIDREISIVHERFTNNFYYEFGPYYYEGELSGVTVLVHSIRKSIDLQKQAELVEKRLAENLEKSRAEMRIRGGSIGSLTPRSKKRLKVLSEKESSNNSVSEILEVLKDNYAIKGFSELTLLLDALYNAPASFYVKDSNGRHLYCNGLALKILGVDSFDEVKNKTARECFGRMGLSDEFIEIVEKNDRLVMEGLDEFCEVEKAKMDGATVYFVSNKSCIRHDESGESILVGVSTYTTNPSTLIKAFV